MSAWLGGFEGGLAHGVPAANIEQFKEWLFAQPKMHGLQLVILHNTGAPSIMQTESTPGGYDQRERNIGAYYKRLGWRGGPSFNVYPDGTIRGGTPWPLKGINTPSWNDISVGVEMCADFRPGVDDDDSGKGLVEKNTACAVIAAILYHQGLPVSDATVKLHHEDPRTTHACPGPDVVKPDIMARVQVYYDAMGTPGEHNPEVVTDTPLSAAPWISPLAGRNMVVATGGLVLRESGGTAGKAITSLSKDQGLKVWSTSSNGSTQWAHVTGLKRGATAYFDGFVAAAYLKAPPVAPPVPPVIMPGMPPFAMPPIAVVAPPVTVIPTPSDNPHWAMQILMHEGGLADFRAAGAIGNWMVESYADLRPWVMGDYFLDGKKSSKGVPGAKATAFGVAQVRNERKAALDAFATARGKLWDDFETQVLYLLQEVMTGLEHPSGALLMKATNIEEATAAYVSAERPAGWWWPHDRTDLAAVVEAAKKVSHWDWRLRYAKQRLASV